MQKQVGALSGAFSVRAYLNGIMQALPLPPWRPEHARPSRGGAFVVHVYLNDIMQALKLQLLRPDHAKVSGAVRSALGVEVSLNGIM